jgi:hypothetical protein
MDIEVVITGRGSMTTDITIITMIGTVTMTVIGTADITTAIKELS